MSDTELAASAAAETNATEQSAANTETVANVEANGVAKTNGAAGKTTLAEAVSKATEAIAPKAGTDADKDKRDAADSAARRIAERKAREDADQQTKSAEQLAEEKFERKLAVRDAVNDALLDLGLAREDKALFKKCETVEDVEEVVQSVSGLLVRKGKAWGAKIEEQLEASGLKIMETATQRERASASKQVATGINYDTTPVKDLEKMVRGGKLLG